MMNRQAQAWGLKNTTFKNVTGLTEPGHRSSARDLASIAAHIIRDFPEFYALLLDQASTSTTTSPSPTATCCCAATRPSTA